jgi:hypothetical protein
MLRCLAVIAVATWCAIAPAAACKGPSVLFEENFKEPDPAWELYDGVEITGGAMRISAKPNSGAGIVYSGGTFDPADICVDITMPEVKQPGPALGGIIFAGMNYNNFYHFWISPAGTAGVMRRTPDRWLNPVPARKVEHLKARPGAVNTMRVTLQGTRATIYVNDEKITDLRVLPMKGATLFGLRTESEPDQSNTWSFTNVRITDIAPAERAQK